MTVDDFADSLYKEVPPARLYHYTTLKGLLGILESGAIWASEVRYLNDSAEIALAFNLIAKEVDRRSEDGSGNREVLSQLRSWVDIRSSRGPMVFVSAFTQNGNLLSQWRGYSQGGPGISFGVASAHLLTLSPAHQFSLGRCRYNRNEQRTIIDALVDQLVDIAQRDGPSDRAHPAQSYHPTFARCEESILRIATLIKDSRFEEEDEWRLVSRTVSDYVSTPICYRAGISMLIPYLKLPLVNSQAVVPIDDVIVGPTPHPDSATESAQRCVARHLSRKHGPWTIRYCGIPYRSW